MKHLCLYLGWLLLVGVTTVNGAISWTTYEFDEFISSMCMVTDSANDVWLCGAKTANSASGSNANVASSCRKIAMPTASSGWSTIKARTSMKISTFFPGWLLDANPFVCEQQKVISYFNDKAVFLELDEFTNDARCYSCDMANVTNQIECSDLTLSDCEDIFGSCVAFDASTNTLIEVGGSVSGTLSSSLQFFDVESETYVSNPNYGSLAVATKQMGCAVTGDGTLIIAGGETGASSMTDQIQVCEPNGENCVLSAQTLTDAVEDPRVVAIDDCNVLIMGGGKSGGHSDQVLTFNYCDDTLTDDGSALPVGLSEFQVYTTSDYLCTVGGQSEAGWNANMFCTSMSIAANGNNNGNAGGSSGNTPAQDTPSPTEIPTSRPTDQPTERPTDQPTEKPTAEPTPLVTVASEETVDLSDFEVQYTYGDGGIFGQACAALDDTTFVVFGGVWAQSSSYSEEVLVFDTSDWNNPQTLTAGFELNALITFSNMENFYTSHQSTVSYNGYLYVVPTTGANDVIFYKCNTNTMNNQGTAYQFLCSDLCFYDTSGKLDDCSAINYDPCAVKHNEYLLIVGGTKSGSMKNAIVAYDMKRHKLWSETADLAAKGVDFGPLAVSVSKSACSMYNDELYVFGGSIGTNAGQSVIQKCTAGVGCEQLSVGLTHGRYYAQAITTGRDILIACGRDADGSIGEIEIFDAMEHTIKDADSALDTGGREQCCMTKLADEVVVSGGLSATSTSSVAVDTVMDASYQTVSDSGYELSDYTQLFISTSDATISGVFEFQSYMSTDAFQVWMETSTGYALFRDTSEATEDIFMGRGTYWAYPSKNKLEAYSTWYVLKTRYSRSKRISTTITGGGALRSSVMSGDTKILGLDKIIFIVVVIAVVLFIIGLCFVGYYGRQRQLAVGSAKEQKERESAAFQRVYTQDTDTPDKRQTLSTKVLFGNPNDPEWNREVDQAIAKGDESPRAAQVRLSQVTFDQQRTEQEPEQTQKVELQPQQLFPDNTQ